LKYHFVWKTKYSYKILKGEIALRIRDILRNIATEKDIEMIRGNVRPDHIHILISAPAYIAVSKIAQILKGKSSHKLQKEFPDLRKRYCGQHLWARGYFCTTVGAVTEELLKQYIENQEEEDSNFKIWDEQIDKQKKKVKEILKDL
jgi:REP-associated tyrosine transposase